MKKLFERIKRKRILKDIKKAKRVYELGIANFMCISFEIVNRKYYKKSINSIIPEFNRETLNAEYKSCSRRIWWDMDDRESRIKAFDKLIEIYSK